MNKLAKDNSYINTCSSSEYEYEYNCEKKIIQYIDIPSYNMDLIPSNVSISTMNLTCHLGSKFCVKNIYKYMILEEDNVVAIKSPDGVRILRGVHFESNSINKNSGENFYNQYTIIVNAHDNVYLNVKLFNNGSIGISGCKDLNDANIVINKVIFKLKEILMIKKKSHNQNDQDDQDDQDNQNIQCQNLLKEIKFVVNPDEIQFSNFKVNLINTNFAVNYNINKEELLSLLTANGVFCIIATNHACVNVKHKIIEDNKENTVSIFVFQTGNIIITGAKKTEHVRSAYNFIVNFLNKNKNKIMKKNIANILTIDDIKSVLDS